MKIALFDNNAGKFSFSLKDAWEKQGHEVRYAPGYDPSWVDWADILWFEMCDNNLHVATNCSDEDNWKGWHLKNFDLTGKKIICRMHGIDVWVKHYASVNWDYVTDAIYVSPQLQDMVKANLDLSQFGVKEYVIPNGVDINKFPMRKDPFNNLQIAMVGEKFHGKGTDLMLQIMAKLPKCYTLHTCGEWAVEPWYETYIRHFIKENHIDMVDHGILTADEMPDFYSECDYILCPSKRETFSYAVAEGMSMGLKPIIHLWPFADIVWPSKYVWNTIDEAVAMIDDGEYAPQEYRDYILKNYSLELMIKRLNKVLEVK